MENNKKLVYEYILIRFGELSTKGRNRKDFIIRLAQNMKQALAGFPALNFEKTHDHIYVHLNGTEPQPVMDIIGQVFGIRSYALAVKCANDISAIQNAAVSVMADKVGTFKIKAHRADKNFPLHSDGINRAVATAILKSYPQLKVDVHNPDYPVVVEVRNEATYIMAETFVGLGGYPVGVGGKAMLLLSGGIDSPVAGWLAMKRGLRLEAIHFASQPYTSQQAIDKVKQLAGKLSGHQGHIRVSIVPFTELQLAIYEHCDESYAITIMRRMMFRLAQMTAEKYSCLALVTGESVGQVASQTLESMDVINKVVDIPVIRPVVTYDKLEIIALAEKLDTYNTSILPFEDCCTIFDPKNPVTKPHLDKVLKQEASFDWQPLLQRAFEGITPVIINPQTAQEDIDIK